ncbi:heterokaryon incompatibility protein-domain-containing protein, partial [Halenospora varia]
YIALSHCWGKLRPGEVPRYCTTQDNIVVREKGFSIADLPLTFRDAVKVARGLQVQYLWIDSLCIIQGKNGDWDQESERIEGVYASAYCTVAATSAIDSNAGFLKRNVSSEYVHVQDDSGRTVYVCTSMADFDREVEKEAVLNTRAWVMQERFLSRRTIHFGASQVYWECGEGVYCEDLGTKKHFKLDPKFPNLLFRSGFAATIYFLQSFFEDYSERSLSKHTDRVVAISGLTTRIRDALYTRESYGIFELYLHRNLLWQRSGLRKMTLIEYESVKVPSWSWMAYTRGIKFMDIQHGDLEVATLKYPEGDKNTLITNVWVFRDCHLKEDAESEVVRRQILNLGEMDIGWITYDVEDSKDLGGERGVVVGRRHQNFWSGVREWYILIVRQRAENEYKRVGVGAIQQDYLVREPLEVYIR